MVVNVDLRRIELSTIAEAHSGSDAIYHGDNPDWLIVVSQTRDSDELTRSNYDTVYSEASRSLLESNWAVEESNHWAFGWVEFIIVRPNEKGKEFADRIKESLEDYAVLDETLYSQYQHDSVSNHWEWLPIHARMELLASNGDSIYASRCKDASELYERAETTYYHLQES